ncbi:MAG: ACT domain-containing protein [Eubacteriales bacterium]|nr:ACT domain-containing protein [Eubacteriales bacterium]
MYIKQLSIFIENREGRLEEVLNALTEANINIVSMSLADTSEYGLLRLLVTDPEAGKKALKEKGFSAMLTDVLGVKISHRSGKLQELLKIICEAQVNIEYMYALSTGKDDASVVIKTSDLEKAAKLLQERGVDIVTSQEVMAM